MPTRIMVEEIRIRVPDGTLAKIDRLARDGVMTRSEWIRHAIRKAIRAGA